MGTERFGLGPSLFRAARGPNFEAGGSAELDERLRRFPLRTTYRVLHPELNGYWWFFGRVDLAETWFLVRRIEPPSEPLPLPSFELILGRGPFAVADERQLIAAHRIEALVCRASGGGATEAKLAAAREAGISVVMIRRPPPAAGSIVETPAAALAWLIQRLDA